MGERITRDSLMGRNAPELDPGETVQAEWRPDRATYWRDNGLLAGAGAVAICVMLLVLQNPHVAIGTAGAAAAVLLRALWLASEALAATWQMTDRRLIGPGGRMVMLLEIQTVRSILGDVQVVTNAGDKHLIKHQPQAASVVAAITAARARRQQTAPQADHAGDAP